jgi:hypothetical protein
LIGLIAKCAAGALILAIWAYLTAEAIADAERVEERKRAGADVYGQDRK